MDSFKIKLYLKININQQKILYIIIYQKNLNQKKVKMIKLVIMYYFIEVKLKIFQVQKEQKYLVNI